MLEAKPLTIDFLRRDASFQILPHEPLVLSDKVSWNGIFLRHYQHPAHAAPEHCPIQHMVVIHHNCLQVKRQLNGRFKCDRIISGDIVVCPANIAHKAYWNQKADFTLLILEPTLVAHTAYESINPERVEIVPHFATPDPLICQIGLSIKSELEFNQSGSRLYVESMAMALSAHLLRHYSTQNFIVKKHADGLTNSQLQQVIDYIDAHLNQNLSLTELAELVQMISHYFGRQFKQSTGKTPHQYLIECRLEKVKSLLANTQLTIAEIAECTGFNDHSYLTKIFRQHLPMTPKAYRQIQ